MADPILDQYRKEHPLTIEQQATVALLDRIASEGRARGRAVLESDQFWELLSSGMLLAEICKKIGVNMQAIRVAATLEEKRRLSEFNDNQRAMLTDYAKLVILEDITGDPSSKDRTLDAGKSARFALQALDPAFQPKAQVTVTHKYEPINTAGLLLGRPDPAEGGWVESTEFESIEDDD